MRPRALLAALLLPCGALSAQEAQRPGAAPPGLTTAIARRANLEGRVLWMDATANLRLLSTPDGVAGVLQKCKESRINTVVVDVKPISGDVLYASQIASRLRTWRGFDYPPDHDLLLHAMVEGRRRGIRVYAGMNVFCEGHKLVREGRLYRDPTPQAVTYEVERSVAAPSGAVATLAIGENLDPGTDGIVVWTPAAPDGPRLQAEDAVLVVESDTVAAVVDGSLLEGGRIQPPEQGFLLVGRGQGARWILENGEVGQQLRFSGRTVLRPILESASEVVGAFVNPADPAARAYSLSLIQEMAANYAIDGIVLDRMRYSSLRSDFSNLSRELFEKWLGRSIEQFPEEIFRYDPTPGRPLIPGPYFRPWLEWRARNISSFLDEARAVVSRSRPGMHLAAYVGSWYEQYYPVGANWGADDYRPDLPWMSPGYPSTGYARKVDWLTTGCYYRLPTRDDARQLGTDTEETVEAAAQLSERAVNDGTFVYAGINLLDYKGRHEDFRRALQTALEHSQGVMLFDLVYLEEFDWWNTLTEAFASPRRAPHDVPGLRDAIQRTRAALRALPGP